MLIIFYARCRSTHTLYPRYTNRRCPSLFGEEHRRGVHSGQFPCGEPALDLCVLCSDGHVIVRDGQETCVEDGLNGLTLNRFNEQLAVLCQ